MRIALRNQGHERKDFVAAEVRRAHELGPRPEPVCCACCPDYRPSSGCHRHCAAAAWRLAGEGGPLEPLVAPLVFELKKLGVFHPCWSCEGHDDAAGKLWKIPRVWFYSDSVVHVRALAEAIDRLYGAGRLSARWQLVLTFSDPANPDTTFSLEPEPAADRALSGLQADLLAMAEELPRQFWGACDALAARAG